MNSSQFDIRVTRIPRYFSHGTSGHKTAPGIISNLLQTSTFLHYSKLIEQSFQRVHSSIQLQINKTYRIFRIKNQYALYSYRNTINPTFFSGKTIQVLLTLHTINIIYLPHNCSCKTNQQPIWYQLNETFVTFCWSLTQRHFRSFGLTNAIVTFIKYNFQVKRKIQKELFVVKLEF